MTRGSQHPPHINCWGSPTHPNASTILAMVSNCGLPPSDRDLTRPRYSGLFGYFGYALGAGGGVRAWIKSDASPVFAICPPAVRYFHCRGQSAVCKLSHDGCWPCS
ncbi:MAG: hypothetical protein AAB306_04330 [Pseudomonadota bacterium]